MTAAAYHFAFIASAFLAFGIGITAIAVIFPHDYRG